MIAWMLETMVAASLLMLLVLTVRRPVAEYCGAGWAYALWLLPVLLPLLPVPSFLPTTAAPVTIIIPEMPIESAAAAAATVPTDGGGSTELLLMLLALWAGGAVAFAAWQQSTYSAFMLHLGPEGRRARPPSFGGVRVVESDAVDGPVAVGLFRRRIVVPLDFHTRYSETERRLALEHELVHHRRFDLLWNWIGLGLLTINWFNPIVHIAFRAFRADQELACDAAVTRRAPAQRHDYALALVKSASQPGLIAVCPLNHADMLKRRLRMMKKHRASWARTAGGAAALGLVGAAGLALATPGFAHPEPPAPEVIMAAAPQSSEPIIADRDVERLREKCGSRPERGGNVTGDAIICSDEESKDPEVRAIVEKTRARVEERVRAAKISREDMRKIRKSVDNARIERKLAMKSADRALRLEHKLARKHAERALKMERKLALKHAELARRQYVFKFDHAAHRAEIERAMALSRVQLAEAKFDHSHLAEMHAALANARAQLAQVRMQNIRIRPRVIVDVDAAIAQAHKDLENVRIHIDERAIEEQVERSLEHLDEQP